MGKHYNVSLFVVGCCCMLFFVSCALVVVCSLFFFSSFGCYLSLFAAIHWLLCVLCCPFFVVSCRRLFDVLFVVCLFCDVCCLVVVVVETCFFFSKKCLALLPLPIHNLSTLTIAGHDFRFLCFFFVTHLLHQTASFATDTYHTSSLHTITFHNFSELTCRNSSYRKHVLSFLEVLLRKLFWNLLASSCKPCHLLINTFHHFRVFQTCLS